MTTVNLSLKAADNYRLARSHTILTPAAETYWLIKIPRLAMITDVWLHVPTAGSSKTVSIGWAGNGETAQPAGFLSANIADVLQIGMKRAKSDTLVSFEGKWFDSASGLITMTVGTTQTTGKFIVFVEYTVIH